MSQILVQLASEMFRMPGLRSQFSKTYRGLDYNDLSIQNIAWAILGLISSAMVLKLANFIRKRAIVWIWERRSSGNSCDRDQQIPRPRACALTSSLGFIFTVVVSIDDPAYAWIQNWLTLDTRINKRIHKARLNTLIHRRAQRHKFRAIIHPVWQLNDIQAELKPTVQDQIWIWQGWKWMSVKATVVDSTAKLGRIREREDSYEIRRVIQSLSSR